MEAENKHQKLVLDPFLMLVNYPKQPLHARIYFKKDSLKEDYQKVLKRLTLFFFSNPVPFNGQSYQKQKEPGTIDQLFFTLEKRFRKTPLLVIYCLTKFDDALQNNF